MNITQKISEELGITETQASAAIGLLDEGATVPFIARYRKEATQGLDDIQLRQLEERLGYLRELEERRATVLKSIREQDLLTPELEASILEADTKARLEDLYLPFKPKRRTKAQIAREAGLEPLADTLLDNPGILPEQAAKAYINAEQKINNTQDALDGAKQILMERFAEDAELVGELRERLWQHGLLRSRVISGKEAEAQKFQDYFEYEEALKKIPSHRALALFRGQILGLLSLELIVDEEAPSPTPAESRIAARFGICHQNRPGDDWLAEVVRWTWKIKIFTRLDLDLKMRLREMAEAAAIDVFAANLKDLLLAAPAGFHAIMGLDPGIRTGVKVALIDATGKVLATDTIYPHAPKNQWDQSIDTLAKLAGKHKISLVSIGNGTASRETEKLVKALCKRHPELGLRQLVVSEAGASVYSASELASMELPDLDVSLRGAVSIARRLQDPLAELVKIDPKSIGVGQYQHDVNQSRLARSLSNVVEDCVNAVGVDVNTASPALLEQVSGLSATVAANIVAYRNENGAFASRNELLKIPRLGAKTFEQAAGFLRIPQAANSLDASAVHPEAYDVVTRIARRNNRKIEDLIGDAGFLRTLKPQDYVDDRFGVPTVRDILAELEKPGRDPRPEFKTANFSEGVEKITDLEPGMILEGVVSNVADFGAFVDIGVHQDGLVHISALSYKYVKNPRDEVKTGDVVKVKVMSVDPARKRISLSMRLDDEPDRENAKGTRPEPGTRKKPASRKKSGAQKPRGSMANALQNALNQSRNS
ncbi:Tex family protein [Thiolapillus brandeum]|uniref:S1 RNA binding domain protein n=1 Tax=Thiolapillus brandeum TaxID=1076588 RepID=A0A7U6JHS2_9GAMM|nr:Tex family protein [Thiolapillus brandeum]BAO44616.1 S1 RNA binding domain protein [Thiolapillus brandeum]